MSVEKASSDDSRNKIVLGVVVVVAVLCHRAGGFHLQQAEGRQEQHPAAKKAALTLLETIPVKGPAPKTGYSRDQFGPPWTDDVDVEGGHNGCDTRDDILRRTCRMSSLRAAAQFCPGCCMTRIPAKTSSSIEKRALTSRSRSIRTAAAGRRAPINPRARRRAVKSSSRRIAR